MTQAPLADLRTDYRQDTLSEDQARSGPFEQFQAWFDEARQAGVPEPNAMTLCTVGANGRPSSRIVLLKDVDARGLVWYTNRESRKGRELAHSPFASLQFHWVTLQRQVRIEGSVERVADEQADAYFASRPLASRLGAWASDQSTVIAGRGVLEQRLAEARERFGEQPPRPPHWGGYRLLPDAWEFWQGRPSRLHDRLRYRPAGESRWLRERLAP